MATSEKGSISPAAVLERALDIDNDLKIWKDGLPPSLRYCVVSTETEPHLEIFGSERHVYPSPWYAEIWDNWRVQRILVNQIVLQNSPFPNEYTPLAVSTIQQMSRDLCVSVLSLDESPRKC